MMTDYVGRTHRPVDVGAKVPEIGYSRRLTPAGCSRAVVRGAGVVLMPLLCLVAGCGVTSATYEQQLQSWVGTTEADLVEQFGPPESAEDGEGGTRILVYSSERARDVSSGPSSGGGLSVAVSAVVTDSCALSFTLLDGIVTGFEWLATAGGLFGDRGGLFGDRQAPNAGECAASFPAERPEVAESTDE